MGVQNFTRNVALFSPSLSGGLLGELVSSAGAFKKSTFMFEALEPSKMHVWSSLVHLVQPLNGLVGPPGFDKVASELRERHQIQREDPSKRQQTKERHLGWGGKKERQRRALQGRAVVGRSKSSVLAQGETHREEVRANPAQNPAPTPFPHSETLQNTQQHNSTQHTEILAQF